MKRRGMALLLVFVFGFLGMGGRLCYLMLGDSKLAVGRSQSLYTVTADIPRSTIFDRNGNPLTNTEQVYQTVLTPTPTVISAVHEKLQGAEKEAALQTLTNQNPLVLKTAFPWNVVGAYSLLCYDKTPFYQTACHLVGHLDSTGKTGVSGLQKAFDSVLQNTQKTTLTYTRDAAGGMLPGGEVQMESGASAYRYGVMTTLDMALQQAVEQVYPGDKKGAVVITKVGSGELLAMYSSPTYSPAYLAEFLNREDSPFLNRALTAYNVGSLFKLCVAAAALEAGISVDATYTCTGSITCGREFSCHEKKGHGTLNMEQAMTVSCNPYFIDLAAKVGGERIYEMAQKLGFGQSNGLCDGIEGEAGQLPVLKEITGSPAALANFAIGQGEFMATCLQLNRLTATIAGGGVSYAPWVYRGQYTPEGTYFQPGPTGNRVMSQQTAFTLQKMMEKVMTKGTGQAGANQQISSGGKTATAQTGMIDSKGNAITQAWFTGYFPAENPEYAVTVLVEQGTSGGSDAAPIFGELLKKVKECP